MKKKPTIQQINYYSFDHKAVTKHFEGNPVYCNTFCINGEYKPVSVYYSSKPNRKKGHKDYLLLSTDNLYEVLIRGMNKKEIEPFRFQNAVHCLKCNDIIYSVIRHDFRHCSCESVNIDGGKDYTKIGYKSESKYKVVVLDLIKNKVTRKKPKLD